MDKQQSNAANVASDSSVIVSNNNLPTVQNNAELQAIPLDLSFPSFLIKMLGVNPLAYSNVGDHTTSTTPSNESNHNQNEQSYPKTQNPPAAPIVHMNRFEIACLKIENFVNRQQLASGYGPDFEVKDPSQIPYFNSIMNSKAALHIHEGITPHVSTASCLPTNEYPKYAMKRTLDDESMNPKRPRPDGDCLAHNILKTITTELIPVVNEVIERPPSVEFLCFKKAEEASMTGHVPQMASMIATGQCQGVPAFFPTVPQINNYSVNQTIQTAPEPVQSQIPPAVQQKTLSTIHVFTDVNGGNSNDLVPIINFTVELYNVTYHFSRKFRFNSKGSNHAFAMKICQEVENAKKEVVQEHRGGSSLTISETETVSQRQHEIVRIKHSTVRAICFDETGRKFFAVVQKSSNSNLQNTLHLFSADAKHDAKDVCQTIKNRAMFKQRRNLRKEVHSFSFTSS